MKTAPIRLPTNPKHTSSLASPATAKDTEQKQLYTHFICAVDTTIVDQVFGDIRSMVLANNIRSGRYGYV